jgi:hypothetical protein
MRIRRWKVAARTAALVTAGVTVAACGNTSGPGGRQPVSLSVTVPGPTPSASPSRSPSFDVTQTAGDSTLVLSDVALVLKKVELEPVDGSCAGDSASRADSASSADSTSSFDSTGGSGSISGSVGSGPSSELESEHEDCEVQVAGPMLVTLPLDGALDHVASLELPVGTYEKADFDIHAANASDSADAAFLSEHPGFDSVSVRVDGTWNGQDFTFERRLELHERVALQPPLEVTDSGSPTNLTLTFDVRTWFVDGDGVLVDPATAAAGGPNAELVARNIRDSMRGFEDRDQDGHEDAHGTAGDTTAG